MSHLPFRHRTPFLESDLRDMEIKLGRDLPEDYRKFVQEYGGAFVEGDTNTTDDLPILCFYKKDDYLGPNSLFDTYDYLIKNKHLPIAECEFGNPYVITEDNQIFYIDFSNGETTPEKAADSFKEFIDKISRSRIEPSD